MIQGLILLGDFAQKQGSAEESGHYIGTALRIAVTQNLHTEPRASSSLSELDKEIRRRVWWSAYCAESCSAKIYGRPLLLPDDNLITVSMVSNIHENALTSSSTLLPAPTDDTTIYTGLNQQSSYHRMANSIYHRLLSSPAVTPKDVDEAQQKIDAWHRSSSFCVQLGDRSARPEWHFTARRRQILCDQSLRLLIYRPMLLHWYGLRGSSPNSNSEPTYQDQDTAGEARCRAQGLKIARTTIAMITDSFSNRHYSRLTLSFTLYAFFHALIVPLIHVKTDPWSSASISCMQDLEKARTALDNLPIEGDAQSGYFAVVLRRLFTVASRINDSSIQSSLGLAGHAEDRTLDPAAVRRRRYDIFGGEELALLEAEDLAPSPAFGLDFSEWVHL
ncbi:fungal-specific transcription factor domain-containing protein [Aspergillus terricola var. indicus]